MRLQEDTKSTVFLVTDSSPTEGEHIEDIGVLMVYSDDAERKLPSLDISCRARDCVKDIDIRSQPSELIDDKLVTSSSGKAGVMRPISLFTPSAEESIGVSAQPVCATVRAISAFDDRLIAVNK